MSDVVLVLRAARQSIFLCVFGLFFAHFISSTTLSHDVVMFCSGAFFVFAVIDGKTAYKQREVSNVP
jgi:hypothetical protein